jgi:regulator of protease activity HflC (stomatin/prohibitin superfamily)
MLESLAPAIVDVISLLFKWIPFRLTLITEPNRGLRFFNGTCTREIGPGIKAYWAWIADIQEFPVNALVIESEIQGLTTKDGKSIAVSVGIQYRITDLVAWYTKVHDFEESVSNRIQMIVGEYISQHLFEDARYLDAGVEEEICETLARWGCEVDHISFINSIKSRPLLHFGNLARLDLPESE